MLLGLNGLLIARAIQPPAVLDPRVRGDAGVDPAPIVKDLDSNEKVGSVPNGSSVLVVTDLRRFANARRFAVSVPKVRFGHRAYLMNESGIIRYYNVTNTSSGIGAGYDTQLQTVADSFFDAAFASLE